MDDINDYNYDLPDELIAKEPLPGRSDSRLLVVDRAAGAFFHSTISELPNLLNSGDHLVLNDTKVVPARLFGFRTATAGKWEGLYLGQTENGYWKIIGQSRGKLQPGETLTILPAHEQQADVQLILRLIEPQAGGVWIAAPEQNAPAESLLQQFGTLPLPPYIQRERADEIDWQRYQTVYARATGAVAAPTAGLHFTPELFAECEQRHINRSFVTLHVGLGTFRPIAVAKLSEHNMHAEWCEVSNEVATKINTLREESRRIVAVGTTSMRTLEAAADDKKLKPFSSETNLFIRPPYEFQIVDCLLTNFHLPKSTLLVLVSTFGGHELIQSAYQAAIKEKYRFYSYGDAMLIL